MSKELEDFIAARLGAVYTRDETIAVALQKLLDKFLERNLEPGAKTYAPKEEQKGCSCACHQFQCNVTECNACSCHKQEEKQYGCSADGDKCDGSCYAATPCAKRPDSPQELPNQCPKAPKGISHVGQGYDPTCLRCGANAPEKDYYLKSEIDLMCVSQMEWASQRIKDANEEREFRRELFKTLDCILTDTIKPKTVLPAWKRIIESLRSKYL